MRARAGLGVALFGALVALFGIALMVVLGPDGSVTSGPHDVDTDGIAIVTAPTVLTWSGLQMAVLAELPVNKPVFVGLGNAVDVDNYVKDTKHLEVDSFHFPWQVHTRAIKGRDNLPGAPTALDWWLADSAGLGGASINTTLPDQIVSLAILSVGFSNLNGLKVTVAYGIKGGFAVGAGFALLGVGGIWFGGLLRSGNELWPKVAVDEDDDEEFDDVMYVYVDDDGVEHEISAEEAAAYDIADVTVEEYVVDDEGEEVGELPEPKPPTNSPSVVYLFIDEDGVEHEVSEAELVDYEIVDDEILDDAASDNGDENRP
ncbi:MAG: hypothetical protein H7288_19775 [Kineosporiaceae bacterium]|nr:hypothetical protein [Aeromicrobium sp.]